MDKYINTGELCEKVESVGISFVEIDTRNKILDIIDEMPSADVVKVTRCEYCKYFGYDYEWNHSCCTRVFYHPRVSDNDFCSYAERKETE